MLVIASHTSVPIGLRPKSPVYTSKSSCRVVWSLPIACCFELQQSDTWLEALVAIDNKRRWIRASNVLLAMGKVGAHAQGRICAELGVDLDPLPMYVGVRLETDATEVDHVFRPGNDRKLKYFFDDESKMKTHCVTAGGEILPLRYDGLPLAGGHARSSADSKRTSFSLLWNGLRFQSSAYGEAMRIMQRTSELTGGKLLVQRLVDYRRGVPSTSDLVVDCTPTTGEWATGDVRDVLPPSYFASSTFFSHN